MLPTKAKHNFLFDIENKEGVYKYINKYKRKSYCIEFVNGSVKYKHFFSSENISQ